MVASAIDDAARIGFSVVSLSGGEPLLYEGLDEILATAAAAGMTVNLVSNGILIRSSRFERHAGRFGLVALSLDGPRERHDALRRSPRAFDSVRAAAAELSNAAIPFGVIHTLGSESLADLETTAEIAADWGAKLFQIHPFERSGRGVTAEGISPLTEDDRLDAFLLASLLGDRHPQMRIQLDLVHRDVARCLPEAIHGERLRDPSTPRELVLQEDGSIVPLTYGLGRRYAVADLRERGLADAWSDFLGERWPLLRRRSRAACLAVARGRFGDVAAWHSVLRDFAAEPRAES